MCAGGLKMPKTQVGATYSVDSDAAPFVGGLVRKMKQGGEAGF
jgi:hypothetical protein